MFVRFRASFLAVFALCVLGASAGSARAAPAPWSTGQSQGEDLRIFLVTFGPGDEIFSWFGHTALGVEDKRLRVSRLYNYGMFTFDDKMVVKFVMGRLLFWVAEDPVGLTYRAYARDDRDVRVQELNLPAAKRLEIAKLLSDNVKPENRHYLYHHYFDNCSTRPRDVIDRVLDGGFRQAMSTPARMTLRDHTRRHSFVWPLLSEMMDLGMASPVDRPITRYDEAFLPLELEAQLDTLTYVDETGATVPLVSSKTVVHSSSRTPVPATPPSYALPMALMGVAMGALAVLLAWKGKTVHRRWRRIVLGLQASLLGLVLGVFGAALLFLWTVTDHTITYRNQNLLLLSPLLLAAFPLGIAFALGKGWAATGLRWVWMVQAAASLVAPLLRLLPGVKQDNLEFLLMFIPLNLGLALAFELHARARREVSLQAGGARGTATSDNTTDAFSGERKNGTGRIAANR